MASSSVVSSFSIHPRHKITPLPPLNRISSPSPTPVHLPIPPSAILHRRKNFNLIPFVQTQTRIFNPPSPALETGRSKHLLTLEKKGGFTAIDDFNDVLISLLVADEPAFALKLYADLPDYGLSPDGWTYSIVIRCHCKRNDPFEARKFMDLMMQSGFNPNVITFTVLIDSFCERGRVQKALEVFDLMKQMGCKPNVQTYNCLLKGMCFVGRVEEAAAMILKMKGDGELPDPDVYSFTAVMDGLCRVGRSDEAKELLEEAIGMGLEPSVVTYNSLFIGYCKEGKPKKGMMLLKMMKKRNCEPDYITYSSLLHGLLKWGFISEAFWVYTGMVGLGLKVDERMMNTMLRALCRKSWEDQLFLKDAHHVFDKMRNWGYEVYPNTHQLVIQTLCIGKEIDQALVSLKEMVHGEYFPRMFIINRIIRGLCEEGRINEAVSVLVLVYENRRMPSKISLNILIDELSKREDLRGSCAVYGSALKFGVNPHSKPGRDREHR